MSVARSTDEPKRRLRAPARRTRIAQAALHAFASQGYGSTGMGTIAQEAGVTRAVLYDHFASKKALFLAVLEEQNAIFLGHVGARITGEGSAEERMRATLDVVFSFAEQHPDSWRLLFGNATHGDAEVDAAWRAVHANRTYAVAALLARDAQAAGIDPDSRRAEIMVELLISALSGAVAWWREHPGAPRAALVDAAHDLLWTGLGQLSASGR
jgi:AcrR family transcriptional regulator